MGHAYSHMLERHRQPGSCKQTRNAYAHAADTTAVATTHGKSLQR